MARPCVELENPKTLTVAEAAYIAGVLDSDGCIYLGRQSKKGRYGTYILRVSFTGTNKVQMNSIQETLGNGGRISVKGRDNPKHRPCYDVHLRAEEIRWYLPQILPYLRLKKERGKIALEYLETVVVKGQRKFRADEHHRRRAEVYHKFRELNVDGPKGPPTLPKPEDI